MSLAKVGVGSAFCFSSLDKKWSPDPFLYFHSPKESISPTSKAIVNSE